MKRITAYVNTTRIHWLVEELQTKGINEIMVSEFFRPNSQISKFEFFCEEKDLKEVEKIVHKIGTCGNPADHLIEVKEDEGKTKSIFPFV
ncbi:MAG: hypothetical protein A2057_11840 [Ignavibacteria bacterium GWA2_35_9]|nr:MAG: hypothetical protein A2057_11840 [Ignavibacteria bacterium GWA2_35_9]OGU45347.1 MAG: hypothetical protein A2000_15045 [Ignavibacteria bacterium GWB2_36_8]OGU48037.1 MAG: hypothetical protein A2080_07535 [Ignavibacteria bacterium GWC2_36_12]OGV01378.1 MAG: hypothetical protein A2330_00695 [Ignavibacteria bacterium RIFOXYB2_FULL_36_7]